MARPAPLYSTGCSALRRKPRTAYIPFWIAANLLTYDKNDLDVVIEILSGFQSISDLSGRDIAS